MTSGFRSKSIKLGGGRPGRICRTWRYPQNDRQSVSGLMLVRWTQPAADDLLHICDYTAERFGAAQARRVADAIYESAASLREMPNLVDQATSPTRGR